MKTISLKLEDSIFDETEKILSQIKSTRNRYTNEALAHYNQTQHRQLLESKLKNESLLVFKDSMSVLKEFKISDSLD